MSPSEDFGSEGMHGSGLMGFKDRSYLLITVGIPTFFTAQTAVLAVAPFRMGTSTLTVQILGLGFVWVYSIYHTLVRQGYWEAFREVVGV